MKKLYRIKGYTHNEDWAAGFYGGSEQGLLVSPRPESYARRKVVVLVAEGLHESEPFPGDDAIAALKAFAALDDFSGWHPRYFDAIAKARAAIAKATHP